MTCWNPCECREDRLCVETLCSLGCWAMEKCRIYALREIKNRGPFQDLDLTQNHHRNGLLDQQVWQQCDVATMKDCGQMTKNLWWKQTPPKGHLNSHINHVPQTIIATQRLRDWNHKLPLKCTLPKQKTHLFCGNVWSGLRSMSLVLEADVKSAAPRTALQAQRLWYQCQLHLAPHPIPRHISSTLCTAGLPWTPWASPHKNYPLPTLRKKEHKIISN